MSEPYFKRLRPIAGEQLVINDDGRTAALIRVYDDRHADQAIHVQITPRGNFKETKVLHFDGLAAFDRWADAILDARERMRVNGRLQAV